MLSLLLLFSLQAPSTPTAPAPPISAAMSEEVQAVFDALEVAQFGDQPYQPLLAFALRLNLRDRSGETPHEISADIRFRQERGGLVRISLHDADRGQRIEKGFDGKRYWLMDDQGVLQDLSAREFAQDRDAIDRILTLCTDLLLLLDPKSLQKYARNIGIMPTETGMGIQGLLPRPEGLWPFQLTLNSNGFPISLSLTPPKREVVGPENPKNTAEVAVSKQRFFLFHFQKDFDGRRLPQVIEEYFAPDRKLPARIFELREFLWKKPELISVNPVPSIPED